MRIAGVKGHVWKLSQVGRWRTQIKRMHPIRMPCETGQTATRRRADLKRDTRTELGEQPAQGRALTRAHVPRCVLKDPREHFSRYS